MQSMTVSLPPLHTVFDDKHLVITGATGFLGKVWVSMLLHRFPTLRTITLLVRDTQTASARARIEHAFTYSPAFRPLRNRHGATLGPWLSERIQVVSADLTKPLAGLSTADVAALGRVDAVIHIAGLTDFDPDPLNAVQVNVHGTNHVAALAAALQAPLVHTSTCYAVGRFDGHYPEQVVRGQCPGGAPLQVAAECETVRALCHRPDGTPYPKPQRVARVREHAVRLGWSNIYTYTKALAEQLLAERTTLRTVVIRPGIVECAEHYPFAGWNEGINTSGPLAALLSTPFRRLPARPHHPFGAIPVDAVCRGMTLVLAATLLRRAHAVYHLSTCDTNPLAFGRLLELNGLAIRHYQRHHQVSVWQRLGTFTDNIAGDWHEGGLDSPRTLRNWTRRVRQAVESVDLSGLPAPLAALVQEPLSKRLNTTRSTLAKAERGLSLVQHMLETYKPFIYDTCWTFDTAHSRALSNALHPTDRSLHGLGLEDINWRDYWIHVEYPGLAKWCFPLLRGEQPPKDPLVHPPVELHPPVHLKQVG